MFLNASLWKLRGGGLRLVGLVSPLGPWHWAQFFENTAAPRSSTSGPLSAISLRWSGSTGADSAFAGWTWPRATPSMAPAANHLLNHSTSRVMITNRPASHINGLVFSGAAAWW